ncbi:MAG: peptide-binding protein [Candidatus Omnitrophica bacterium]|nr:peptide-binding protein [Candidatus Omnitrophota bacterium]
MVSFLFFFCLSLFAEESTHIVREAPSYGDAIVVGSIGDARRLIPILASDSASGDITGLLFNGLIKYDKDLKLTGDLAESWEVTDGGLEIVFHLRHDVRWHDGAPFTAADVQFTYQKLLDPTVITPYSGDFKMVESLEVLDDYTVRVTYKEPFAPGLSSWGMGIIPKHLLENKDINTTDFGRNPVGTGPFRFRRWKTGERIELSANPDYFEGEPYISSYIYRIMDQSAMFLELQTEGIDMMGLSPLQYKRQTDTRFFQTHYQKYKYPSFGYTYMAFNLADPRFQDRRVREAINYAIDKEEIIQGVLLGYGRVCTGPFPPESWAYNKDIKPVPFDPKRARDILAEAGWRDSDNDGVLDKDGQPFVFTIITNQGNDQRKMACEIIQRRLGEVGIKVKIRIIEWSVFISEFVNKRRFEALVLGWGLSREPDPYDIWHSSKTKEGEFNFIGYNNPEADRLMEDGRRIFDQDERSLIYRRIHEILYQDVPYVFLYVPDALPIVHARFHGIEVAPAGIGHNFIKWYVPENQQKYRLLQ